jgi:hypothetical protein
VVSDMHIYMLFEGRRYWPKALVRVFVKDERTYLAAIRRAIKNGREWPRRTRSPRTQGERFRRRRAYLEASVDLRAFPIERASGKSYVELPTRLGNILTAFEGYSERVYGLDAIFYWPRLWGILDKDLRSELSTAQAMTDSAVYVSFVLYLSGIANIARYIVYYYLLNDGTAEVSAGGILGAICLGFGYSIYRLSLYLHAVYGEQFKAAFDNFGDKIDLKLAKHEIAAALAGQGDREANRIVWRYLHNFRVRDSEFQLPKRPSAWQRKYGPLDQVPAPAGIAALLKRRWLQIHAFVLRVLD